MTCTCDCHDTSGHRINRRARIGARLVELRAQIPEVEKQARRTPPKTLVAEKQKVERAKALLPYLVIEHDALTAELAGLFTSAAEEKKP